MCDLERQARCITDLREQRVTPILLAGITADRAGVTAGSGIVARVHLRRVCKWVRVLVGSLDGDGGWFAVSAREQQAENNRRHPAAIERWRNGVSHVAGQVYRVSAIRDELAAATDMQVWVLGVSSASP